MAIASAPREAAPLVVPPITTARLQPEDHLPTYERVQRIVYAIGILFPVVGFAVVRAFAAPIKAGAVAQMTYSVAHPALHQAEQIIVPLASLLSLLGVIGLAQLAMRRSPGWR